MTTFFQRSQVFICRAIPMADAGICHWSCHPRYHPWQFYLILIFLCKTENFASAILYSLVETAKANMINTFEYFNLLLTEIPKHMDDKDLRFIDDLLPWSPRVQKECPSRYKKSWFFNVHIVFYKVCSIPARMRGFLLSSTHVWGLTPIIVIPAVLISLRQK